MKVIVTYGREPAVAARAAEPVHRLDNMGRNTIAWLPEIVARPLGPPTVVVALPGANAREYLTREEAHAFAEQLLAALDDLDKAVPTEKVGEK